MDQRYRGGRAGTDAVGNTVALPAGTYLTGSIEMASHMTPHFDAGATILGSPRKSDNPRVPTSQQNRTMELPMPLIGGTGRGDVENVHFNNIVMNDVSMPIHVQMHYDGAHFAVSGSRDVPDSHAHIRGRKGFAIRDAKDVSFDDVRIDVEEGKPLMTEKVRDLRMTRV